MKVKVGYLKNKQMKLVIFTDDLITPEGFDYHQSVESYDKRKYKKFEYAYDSTICYLIEIRNELRLIKLKSGLNVYQDMKTGVEVGCL